MLWFGGYMRTSLGAALAAIVVFSTPAFAQQASFHVGTASAGPGQKATGVVEVPAGVDAGTQIPVVVVRGTNPGPTIALVAGSHGTEYTSIIALETLIGSLDPSQISGTVIL